MSQNRKLRTTIPMSVKPPKADINHTGWNVRFVPTPDIISMLSRRSHGATCGLRLLARSIQCLMSVKAV